MFRASCNIRLFELIGTIVLFFAGLTSAQALQPAGPHRPANVPAHTEGLLDVLARARATKW